MRHIPPSAPDHPMYAGINNPNEDSELILSYRLVAFLSALIAKRIAEYVRI